MTYSKEQLQTFEITLLFPPYEEEEHDGCVSRLLNKLVFSPYFAEVHFLLAPSPSSNCAALLSIYSGWFFLSISSLTYPPVGERLLEHPICSNGIVLYKAYPNHATMVVYNPSTKIACSSPKVCSYQSIKAFFFNPIIQNFRILVQISDLEHSGYSIFNSATRLWNSVVYPFQLTYEEKFIKFDMFALDMIFEKWVQIPFPCNSCDTCFRKLIERRSRISKGELKIERFCVLLTEVVLYDSGSKRYKFYRRFFWHPRVHDFACPRISPFPPTLLCCK
ncbi:hypothetical protein AMTRI_Chr08g163740 [Amborella trichopoda]